MLKVRWIVKDEASLWPEGFWTLEVGLSSFKLAVIVEWETLSGLHLQIQRTCSVPSSWGIER